MASVGSGRLGAKSPKKQGTADSTEKPLASEKIARSPMKSIGGPLGQIGDIIDSMMNGSPSKEDFKDKTSKKQSSSRSRNPRNQTNNSHGEESPVFQKDSKVSRSRTNCRSQTSKRSAKNSSRNKGKTKKTPGKHKDKADRPLVALGKGRMGIKSPKAKDLCVKMPFFTKKMARSPKKVLHGPLEKYSGAIEYKLAPCFQYAEALKPKKNLFPYPGTISPKGVDARRRNSSKSSTSNERTKPKRANSGKESSPPSKSGSEPSRRRRNSSRSDDGAGPSNARRRNPSARDSNNQQQSTSTSPASSAKSNSETSQGKQGFSPRQQSVKESPRSQSSRGISSASPVFEMSPDEDFQESRSPRRSSQNQRPNARRRLQTEKGTRKMAKGKRVKKSYQDKSFDDTKEGDSEQQVLPKSPGGNGSGRGGSKSPRRAQQQDDKPFVSDKISRSPHNSMKGPIAVYCEAIGYKMAPMFQYAEAVKPKPKVVITPLEIPIQSSSKSPKGLKRSSSTSVRVPDRADKSPAKMSRSKSVPAEDSPRKKGPKNTKQPGSRISPRTPSKAQEKSVSDGSMKDNLKSPRLQKKAQEKNKAHGSDVTDLEEASSPVLDRSFVFEGASSSSATLGRGHMGSRSPKDLTKMESNSSDLINSKHIARSPVKEIRGPLGKTQKSVAKQKGDGQMAKKKKEKSALKEDQQSGSMQGVQKKAGGKNASKEIQRKKNESAKVTGVKKKLGPKSSQKDGKGKKEQQQMGSKSSDQPVKKARKPVPLKFDPLTMRSLRIRETTLERVKLCKVLSPQLVLRKLCLDERSWSEVVRNALYRDLDRQAKRKRKRDRELDSDLSESKRIRHGITPPWRKGPRNSSPRKEKLKAIMAAKEGKDIYKQLKGPKSRRQLKTKLKDEFGGGPDNKTWNYVPPIVAPKEDITKNPIPEISEPGKDDTRDVMWQLACYSPQRPDPVSSPPRCWSPVGSVSDSEEEEEDEEDEEDEDEMEDETEDMVAEEEKKEDNAAPVPISDNEMDIIERNLGQISDFSVYEKMLGAAPGSKARQPEQKSNDNEFALEHFQEDVSGIDNHLHGNSERDALSHEFAMLDKSVFGPENVAQMARSGKENVVPHQHGHPGSQMKQEWAATAKQTPVGSHLPSQGVNQNLQQSQSYQNHAQLTQAQVSSAPIPQQTVSSQGTSHSLRNSQGSNSTGSSSQLTPGQKAPVYHQEGSNTGTSSYSPHSQHFLGNGGSSGSHPSQYVSQNQRLSHQSQGAPDPTTIPETDSEHSSTGSPAQNQYSTQHPNTNQQNHQKEPNVQSQTANSMYYHSNLHASQSMYDMSNHSFSQPAAYGENRQPNPNQNYNQSQLPPYPSPSPHQPQAYPPPYPSPQPSYSNHQHPPSSHQHPSHGQTQPQSQPYGVPYPHGQHTYPDSNNANPAAKPKIWRPVAMPPTDSVVRNNLQEYGLSEVHHQGAYWGNPQDHTGRSR